MLLKPLSKHEGSNLKKWYREVEEGQSTPKLGGRMMAELVEHLENNVTGPDVYAFTSQAELVLNDKDTWQSVLVTINAYKRLSGPPGYEITYYIDPPWLCVTGYTENVECAGRMVVEALMKATSSEIRIFR